MLRGKPKLALNVAGGAAALPPADTAFSSEPNRPPGIRFYQAKDSFFLPYSLLQSLHWRGDTLTIGYVHDDVTLEGQGLHALYVEIAEFRVTRIREQAEDDDASEDGAVQVLKIQRLPRK